MANITFAITIVKIRNESEVQLPIGKRRSLEAIERMHIQALLDETGWVIKHTAEILEIDRSTLYKKIEKYAKKHGMVNTSQAIEKLLNKA